MSATLRPEDILTPDELAARLKVPKSWVYEKTRSRNRNGIPLPCLRLGCYIRFDWARVVEWPTQEEDAKRGRRRQGERPLICNFFEMGEISLGTVSSVANLA